MATGLKMNKLKKIVVSGLSVMMCMVAVGCSSGGGASAKTIDVASLKTTINDSELLTLGNQDADAKEHYIFEGNFDKIKQGFVNQAMINVQLQDVIVVEGNTEDDAKELKAALETYKVNSLKMFADGYGGEENATAVANSKLEQVGNVVYFIACANVAEVEKLIIGN